MFALYIHEIEDFVMGHVMDFLASQRIEVFSLIFDGVISSDCSEQLLRETEAYVEEACRFRIKLAEKPLYGLQDQPVPELACIY